MEWVRKFFKSTGSTVLVGIVTLLTIFGSNFSRLSYLKMGYSEFDLDCFLFLQPRFYGKSV